MRVVATSVEDIDATHVPPGAFEVDWVDGIPVGISYACPCGCRRIGYLPFRMPNVAPIEHPSWEFDGSVDRPTLAPSILHQIGGHTHWHGYLRGGVWETA